jgi:hypothetical protein
MGLLLPDSVVREVRGERTAEIEIGERDAVCAEYTRELKKIDSYLELIFFPQRAPAQPGLFPGAYHVVRWNPTAAPTVEALVDRFGGPLALGSWVYDKVRASDLWNAEVVKDRERFEKRALAARDAAKAREREDHMAELTDRANAAWRTQVSLSDQPWSQNSAGARGRKA